MGKKNTKGGKKGRRGKNDSDGPKRELIYKEEGQEYAQITKMLGNGRVSQLLLMVIREWPILEVS
ncbi:CGH_1_HP_G0103040.mRNA.1.CDS.1 [Saccharomyces cerevisiae]|nr:CGH_1_HP_G0103040.mRNA.1.CDS.1 [Saccharomyces cerevisiae]CAI6950174.1 CGH_1_HP_G0103040.mRNA.1.CDS.1 [Saccharomyces cerevisiae]